MTVMFDKFFGVPPYLMRSGQWRKLKHGARDLYVFLCERSEYYCSREITVTDAEAARTIGRTAPRTFRSAREQLKKAALVEYKAGLGNRLTYVLLNPETGKRYDDDHRKRLKYQKAISSPVPALLPFVSPQETAKQPQPEASPVTRCLEHQWELPCIECAKTSTNMRRPEMSQHGLKGVF